MRSSMVWGLVASIIVVVGGGSWALSRMAISSNIEAGKEEALKRADQRQADEEVVARERKLSSLLATIEDSLAARPLDSMLVISAANIAYDLGQFDKASRFYGRFLDSIDASVTSVRIDYSYALFQTGQQKEALAELESIIKKDPKNQSALFNIAVMHTQMQQFDQAKTWFERCRAADPASPIGERAKLALEQLSKTS
ncbi:MAG: tetratricopeptide repeat protein [Candidatus Kapabacteria bacterium]|nr:tetratricopeptide repeat protein [Candidatus Kapabacteria bacterium]